MYACACVCMHVYMYVLYICMYVRVLDGDLDDTSSFEALGMVSDDFVESIINDVGRVLLRCEVFCGVTSAILSTFVSNV